MTPGEVSAVVTGTAHNRVLTLQWFNLIRKSTGTNYTVQVKLFETRSIIEILYLSWGRTTETYGLNYGDGSEWTQWPTPSANSGWRLTPN